MFLPILAKIAAEAMLSFYPMMIKLINIPILSQMWTRFITYSVISSLFVDWDFIIKSLFTQSGISLVLVSLLHVYTSYRGFELLESGVSYSLFYVYPIIILLFSGEKYTTQFLLWCLVSLLGVYLLSDTNNEHFSDPENPQNKEHSPQTTQKEMSMYGIFMIMLAAITEAWIYFIVRDIKTTNNWNHVFLSYSLGAVGLSIYQFMNMSTQTLKSFSFSPKLLASLGMNSLIGLFGYLLRFYATSRLEPIIYAPLSYVGVVMAYIYGIFLNQDSISWKKIMGTLCIIVPNLMLLKK